MIQKCLLRGMNCPFLEQGAFGKKEEEAGKAPFQNET